MFKKSDVYAKHDETKAKADPKPTTSKVITLRPEDKPAIPSVIAWEQPPGNAYEALLCGFRRMSTDGRLGEPHTTDKTALAVIIALQVASALDPDKPTDPKAAVYRLLGCVPPDSIARKTILKILGRIIER